MPTPLQNEVIENIEAGIKFLRDHSGQTDISLGDVLERAGYDRQGTKFYPLVKSLRLKSDDATLLRLRTCLLEVHVKAKPLEEWHRDYKEGNTLSHMLREPSYGDESDEPFPETAQVQQRGHYPIEADEKIDEDELEESEDARPSPICIERNRTARTNTYELEEHALMTIMRALVCLNSDQRERIFQAAQSFYAVGMR